MAVLWEGFLGALVAVVCFGSYAVPVKMFPTGDGIVFQWIECCAILVVGFLVELIVGTPYYFEPLAMIGGALWCLGNVTVIPIVDSIGLGLGMLVWGIVNMVIGWSTGHFGIFVSKETVQYPILNYIGVFIAAASIGIYFPIKTETKKVVTETNEERTPLMINVTDTKSEITPDSNQNPPKSSPHKKLFGIVGAFIAGGLYGFNITPVSHLQDEYPNASPLAFAMSLFTGIFLMSTLVLIIYCIAKKNKPQFYPQSILPALIAGTLWAIAQSGWFVGNKNLGLTVAFPIICTGPGIVASLWGVFVFQEIRGMRNFVFLGTAFLTTVVGILFITFSH